MGIRNKSLTFFLAIATVLGQKIDPRVVERAQSTPLTPVFIVLEHQPQREVLARVESANALYRQVAESRYRQAASRSFPDAEELRQAREATETVLLRTRQQAFQAIEQAVGQEQDALESHLKGLGAARITRYLGINMLAAEIPASAIAALEADPTIAHVFPVEQQYAQLATSVPALGAPAFWNAGYTGQGESVGILDSGIKTNHPAFAGKSIVSQVFLTNGSTDPCFTDNATSFQDQFGHGTHVAGIVASQGSAGWTNYQGVAKGIGTLYNLKIGYTTRTTSDCEPAGALSDPRDVLAALDWAIANTPLRIFNYSWGSPMNGGDDDGFTQSIDQYIDTYSLTLAIAAGNGGQAGYGVTSPGIAYNSITVANWASRGVINGSSSRGPTNGGRDKPDLAAPGTSIYSAGYNWDNVPGSSYVFVSMTGTSMAAPHIAGSAALLGSAGITDPLAVKAILINSADSAGAWANDSGWGYANLNTALGQLNYATGSLAAGDQQFYKVSLAGTFQATVVWNRHVSAATSNFNNIGLHLYRADTGAELTSSATAIQNVEQVSATYEGEAVLGVAMASSPLLGVNAEPYAVAFSVPGAPITRTGIGLSCSLPASILSGSQLNMTCSLSDTAGLGTPALVGQVALPAGFSGPTQMFLGAVQPGSVSSPVTIGLTAPEIPGTYAIRIDVPVFFGTPATVSYAIVVQPALPAPVLISPANGASGVSLTPALVWNAAPGATSYDVYFGTSARPPAVTSTTATSYTATALNGSNLYYWRVVSRNGSGASTSPTWAFTTRPSAAGQQQYTISTVAGTGTAGFSGDEGPATSAQLNQPSGLGVDATGALYIADRMNMRVRKVALDGIISTVAGNGTIVTFPDGRFSLGDGGPATSAQTLPNGVALDSKGNLYIADDAMLIRKVGLDGVITTVAGNGGAGAYSGDGGPATSAGLSCPNAVAADGGGDLFIADTCSGRIRKVTPDGIIRTFAGGGHGGADGVPATSVWLGGPTGVALDAAGDVFIADTPVRKVTLDGTINTIAGMGGQGYSGDGGPATAALLNAPEGLATDGDGNVFIADTLNNRIRKVAPDGTIATIAGNGAASYSGDGDLATNAALNNPASIAVGASGSLYVADTLNNVVRMLVPVSNASCQYRLDQTAMAASAPGGAFPISIQTGPACWWSLVSLPSWITGQAFGKGSGTVMLTLETNPGALRTATISIAGTALTVMQGAAACTYSLGSIGSKVLPGGASGSIAVTADPGCPWSAATPTAWLTLTGPTSGIGSGTVSYTVAPNSGGPRSATLTIAGLSFNVEQFGQFATSLRFLPVPPCRIADTRVGGATMAAGSSRSFPIPQSGCNIPATAQAYSLNVTAVPEGPLSYLTLWPTGQNQPFVSTLNSLNGNVVANAALVPAGFDGAVSVYVTNPTDVILDINGYFDSGSGAAFYPALPCRVADTRNPAGPFGGPSLGAGQSRDFPVPSSPCNLPSTASAYSMNMTVVPNGFLGYLTTWPTGQPQPLVSTLNSWTGKIVANAAIVPAGNGGAISVFAADATAVVVDANGYFAPPGASGALNFYPVAPCRIADTRNPDGPFGGPEMEAGAARSFPVPSSACGIPPSAAAYSMNVTVVPDGPLSYLTAWPTGSGQPFVSTLNALDGAIVANAAIVPAGPGGAISVYVTNRTHVVLDINGYFAP
jgi:subtilisin family serine protease/sugar lactone lactonase YvrE